MHVDNAVERWSGFHESLPLLLSVRYLFYYFSYCADVNSTETAGDHVSISAGPKPVIDDDLLLLNGQVCGNSIGWMDGFVRLSAKYSRFAKRNSKIGSVTYVASLPAYFRIILLPPGCSIVIELSKTLT